MERLSGIDANFLYMETPAAHMHTIKVAVIEPAPGTVATLASVKHALHERLHLLPQFRRRLVPVPLGLHHPVWIEDPAFDLDRHVLEHDLPAPGGWREVEDAVARIASSQLDRSRALWELWLLRGFAERGVVLVAKIHHALADGVAVAALLAGVMDDGDEPRRVPALDRPWAPEPVPPRGRLLRDALLA
ncbi:wax ester/triacylglycerol synthase family O-acyltransferase, partial [Candidatus Binatia bacterium]|nr:wax ester/triacylglycerol synthase family O-acyltransferase [Candidatus Binatia bacterium]